MRFLSLLAASACVVPVDVAGGASHATYSFKQDHLGDSLRPLVADDPNASAQLERVIHRDHLARTALYTGLGLLVIGVALGANSQSTMSESGAGVAGLGLIGASMGFDVASIVLAPKKHHWADVLRTYNADHPDTSWTSSALDVH